MVEAAVGVPPCCAGCAQYDRDDGVCQLLADPILEQRRLLLTMPCEVQRLIQLRFRGAGPEVAQEALGTWLSPDWDPDDLSLSYGKAPRDARLWLGSWPYLYLVGAARRAPREGERLVAEGAEEQAESRQHDPALALRMTRALEKVHRIDPVGYPMLLDFLRDHFDAQAWAATLDCGAASVTDRKYLAIYRYAVYFHEVVEGMAPHEAALALATRRLSPGDPTEHAALEATRVALSSPELALAEWRGLYREGAMMSLALLAAPEALGEATLAELGPAFRRVLQVDAISSGQRVLPSTTDPGERSPRQRLAAPLRALPRSAGADHVEPELLIAHAANELPPEQALFVTRHLAFCTDGRCPAWLAEVAAGMAVARDALYDHRRDEPVEASVASVASERESARTFECRDGLWEIFEAMARDEGTTPDRLIAEAMRVYAQQRPRATGPGVSIDS